MSEADLPRVLIVDDDPAALTLLRAHLTSSGYETVSAGNGVEAMRILASEGPSMVLTDWQMPEMDGLELCRRIRAHEGIPFAYVIIITAHSDQDRVVEAFNAGVDDYLPKPVNKRELIARVRAGMRITELQVDLDRRNLQVHRFNAEMAVAQTKLHEANERLCELATTDELTGLINRRAAMERLKEHWASARRHDEPLACIMLDIDHFKNFNDTCGHAVGDWVLKETAAVLRKTARAEEHICRIGGEEFLVLCPKSTEEMASIAAERIRQAVEANIVEAHEQELSVTISLGVAQHTTRQAGPDELLRAADNALYAAKHQGRNRVCRASQCEHHDPINKIGRMMTRAPAPPPTTPDQDIRVLIVDGNMEFRGSCRQLLEQAGYRVAETDNADAAISGIEDNPPAVVILDSSMPATLGIECARRLKMITGFKSISIIAATHTSSLGETASALASGADDCIARESLHAELIPRVQCAVRSRRDRSDLVRSNEVRGELSRMMGLLTDYAYELAAGESLEDVLERTVNVTADLTLSRHVSIMLPDASRTHLSVAKAIGIDESLLAEIRLPLDRGIAGPVFRTGEAVIANATSDIGRREHPYESMFFVSVPLISKALSASEYTVGVLNISERLGARPFEPHDLEHIDLICNIAAGAIHERLTRLARDEACDSIVFALATLAEYRDSNTGRHLHRVSRFCHLLARELRRVIRYRSVITDQFLDDLQRAVPLHDVGKVAVPDQILLKPGKLTQEECAVVKMHTTVGAETIRSVVERVPGAGFLLMAKEIAHTHHEHYDGNGYPLGLRGDDIPLAARIAAVADVYDAMTTKHPYKEPMTHERAALIILSASGSQFDPDVVQAFDRCQEEFRQLAHDLTDDDVSDTEKPELTWREPEPANA
ncbi:MAG: response regulator [Phycisphaerales bacterium]|nr:MAG: response regulator [Phycisphaerales bacterium]